MRIFEALLPLIMFFLGVMFTRWQDEQASSNSHISEILDETKKIEDLSVEYWTRDHSPKRDPEIEVKIRGLFFVIFGSSEITERCTGKRYGDFYKTLLNFFDTITNGSFETKRRRASPDRATEIVKQSAELRRILYDARTSSSVTLGFVRAPFRMAKRFVVWFFNL